MTLFLRPEPELSVRREDKAERRLSSVGACPRKHAVPLTTPASPSRDPDTPIRHHFAFDTVTLWR